MPCYRPLDGWRSKTVNPSGKRGIVFDRSQAFSDLHVTVPCGQCIGCRLEYSRQWAIRCVHEASLYDDNCFVTLTYSDQFLPPLNSIVPHDATKFMERLRDRFSPRKIRSYGCGEYGERFGRPHYHICLFNFDFLDKVLFREINGNKLFTSKILSELWPYGHSTIGSLTFESAAYVARYCTKKISGPRAEAHYGGRVPERPVAMSRRPGIGKPWLDKWMQDVYPSDSVICRGREVKPPKFYDRQFELVSKSDLAKLRFKRMSKIKVCGCISRFCPCIPSNDSGRRLLARETVKRAQLSTCERKLEDDN